MSAKKHPPIEDLPQLVAPNIRWLRAKISEEIPKRFRAFLDVDDALQEVWIKLFTAHKRFEWQGEAAFRGWLAEIAEKTVLDEIKKLRRIRRGGNIAIVREADPLVESDDPLSDLVVELMTPSRIGRENEVRHLVLIAIDTLRADYAECLRLRFFSGMGFNEIGQRLGKDANAARSHFIRAKEKLRGVVGRASAMLS